MLCSIQSLTCLPLSTDGSIIYHVLISGKMFLDGNTFVCITVLLVLIAVADPGFPVGGCGPARGTWTSDMGAFWQKCM